MSIENKNDYKNFTQRVYISKALYSIYDMLTVPVFIEKWFVKSAMFYDTNGIEKNRNKHIEQNDTWSWE